MKSNVNFEANDLQVRDILFADYAYIIPRYQRPYTWDDDQVSEFWNDLISNDGSSFLGSLIFNYENFEDSALIDIIDGQQRLLTITIFVAVLRDIAKKIDVKKAELFQRHDIAFEDRLTGKQTYRITPGDQTRVFFETNVQQIDGDMFSANPENDEQKKIKTNYLYFFEKVTDELKKYSNKEDQLKYINSLRDKVGNLTVIHIQINNEEEAYEIFETTNARGVDLSVADLLKNLIFKKLPPNEDKDYARDRWEEITSLIEETSTEMRKFIRYFWISRHSSVTEKRLFREIKKETVNYNALLDDLWQSAYLYNKILEGSTNDWDAYKSGKKMFRAVSAIRLMNVSQCYVLFLAILRNFDKLGTDPAWIFESIENFSFKYSSVCKLPSNKVEKIYAKYAKMIEEAIATEGEKRLSGKIQSILAGLDKELKILLPKPDHFKSEFCNISYKNTEQTRKLIKYVLNKIDGFYRITKEEIIDFDNVNIEHILPQNPNKAWGLKKSQIKEYVNKLGNLTLLDKKINSIGGNKPIQEKISILKNSALPINKKLLEEFTDNNNIWDEASINIRQKQLAELACNEVWKL